jgi:hypothetical protein
MTTAITHLYNGNVVEIKVGNPSGEKNQQLLSVVINCIANTVRFMGLFIYGAGLARLTGMIRLINPLSGNAPKCVLYFTLSKGGFPVLARSSSLRVLASN